MGNHLVVDCLTGEAHLLSEGMSVTTSDGQIFHHHELEAHVQKIRAGQKAEAKGQKEQGDSS